MDREGISWGLHVAAFSWSGCRRVRLQGMANEPRDVRGGSVVRAEGLAVGKLCPTTQGTLWRRCDPSTIGTGHSVVCRDRDVTHSLQLFIGRTLLGSQRSGRSSFDVRRSHHGVTATADSARSVSVVSALGPQARVLEPIGPGCRVRCRVARLAFLRLGRSEKGSVSESFEDAAAVHCSRDNTTATPTRRLGPLRCSHHDPSVALGIHDRCATPCPSIPTLRSSERC